MADATQVMSNFNYIIAQVNSNAMPIAGGTMTGALILSGDASANLQATTYEQLLTAEGRVGANWTADNTGSTDASTAINNAITALPTGGGSIRGASGTYLLNSQINYGGKSVTMDFGTGVSFTGAGVVYNQAYPSHYPFMQTNNDQMAVGPYWLCQGTQMTPQTPIVGGVACINAEIIQPSSGVGSYPQNVAAYLGAQSANPSANAVIWSLNSVNQALAAFGGKSIGYEIDSNKFCPVNACVVSGLSITGASTTNPDFALSIGMSGASWKVGLTVNNSINVLQANMIANSRGIIFTPPSLSGSQVAQSNVLITAMQNANNTDMQLWQRWTDSSPTGTIYKLLNAAGGSTLASLDVNGVNTMTEAVINLASASGYGIVITPASYPNTLPNEGGTIITLGQSNAGTYNDMQIWQRNSDASPVGYFYRAVNAANSQNLAYLTTAGQMRAQTYDILSGGSLIQGKNCTAGTVVLANIVVTGGLVTGGC